MLSNYLDIIIRRDSIPVTTGFHQGHCSDCVNIAYAHLPHAQGYYQTVPQQKKLTP
jgi:hypothetical protein